MLRNLPKDLQRSVCLYLDDTELSKTDVNFSDDDVFWALRLQSITHITTTSRKMYYEAIKELNSDSARNYLKFGLYRKYLTENYWTKVSALQIINDEIFIVRYINCTDKGGTTLLEYLCCKQNLPNRTDLIRKLLTNGAKSGQALSNYCYYPDSSKEHPILRMLVEYGADVNGKVNNIKIPLIFLVKDDVSVVKVLIELGADVFVKDSNNRDIVQYSRYHGHLNVAKYLEDYISTLKKDN